MASRHRYWSVVENTRVAGGRVAQRHVLYSGRDQRHQELAWRRSIAVLEDGAAQPRTLSLFPEDRCEGLPGDASVVRVEAVGTAATPAAAGACWLARTMAGAGAGSILVQAARREPKGTRCIRSVVLVADRCWHLGSELAHRERLHRSARADLLGEDAGLAEIHKLYRCHDRLLTHKQAVFDHWGTVRDLFNISYDVLLYDLTSTYFEADPPFRKATSAASATRA